MPGPPPAGLEALAAALRAGDDLPTALERAGGWLPSLDRALIAAGAEAGRLPDVMRRLATRHEDVVRVRVALALAAAYPIAILHLGALAFPVQRVVTEGVGAYAAAVLQLLVPLWCLAGVGVVAVRLRLRPAMVLLDLLPFVGGHRRARALADLAFVLEALMAAGVRVDRAWIAAARASEDRRLVRVAQAVAGAVEQGQPVAPVLSGRREVPPLFAEYYRTGEATGRLDDALMRLHHQFSDTAATQLKVAGMAYPALLFALVAAWVAIRVVLFYAGYFRQLDTMAP